MPLIKLGIQLLLIAEEHTQLYSSFLQVVHSNSRSSGSWFISAVRLLEYRTTYGVNCVWPAYGVRRRVGGDAWHHLLVQTNQKRPFSLYLTIVYLIISKSLNLGKKAIKKLLLTRWGRSTTNITTSSFGTEGLNIFAALRCGALKGWLGRSEYSDYRKMSAPFSRSLLLIPATQSVFSQLSLFSSFRKKQLGRGASCWRLLARFAKPDLEAKQDSDFDGSVLGCTDES